MSNAVERTKRDMEGNLELWIAPSSVDSESSDGVSCLLGNSLVLPW